jgi:maltoporin
MWSRKGIIGEEKKAHMNLGRRYLLYVSVTVVDHYYWLTEVSVNFRFALGARII